MAFDLAGFFSFLSEKMKNFKTLALPEQLAFAAILVGAVLIFGSLVLLLL